MMLELKALEKKILGIEMVFITFSSLKSIERRTSEVECEFYLRKDLESRKQS